MDSDWLGFGWMTIFLEISILLILGTNYCMKKIKYFIEKEPKKNESYKDSLNVGVVSGIIVIIMDRIITTLLSGLQKTKVDTTTPFVFFASFSSMIIYSLFMLTSLLFLVAFMSYLGTKK